MTKHKNRNILLYRISINDLTLEIPRSIVQINRNCLIADFVMKLSVVLRNSVGLKQGHF